MLNTKYSSASTKAGGFVAQMLPVQFILRAYWEYWECIKQYRGDVGTGGDGVAWMTAHRDCHGKASATPWILGDSRWVGLGGGG